MNGRRWLLRRRGVIWCAAVADELMRRRIVNAWFRLRVCSLVAQECGVTERTAYRYRPGDLRRFRPTNQTSVEDISRIIQLSSQGLSQRDIARQLKINEHTVRKYTGRVNLNSKTGYSTWSEETRRRWDEFWDPHKADLRWIVENWNNGIFRRERRKPKA